MRELDECTAEVFRRGEQRIKERRRKRNRALALCIPVVLIAAVWSFLRLPVMQPLAEALEQNYASGEAAGSAPETNACPYTAAEIKAPERCEEVTDRLAVAEMFGAVNSIFADANRDASGDFLAESFPTSDANTSQVQDELTGTWKGCTIAFTAEDGSRAVYHFNENTLVNVSTNEKVFLSDAQTAGLMAVLGISE